MVAPEKGLEESGVKAERDAPRAPERGTQAKGAEANPTLGAIQAEAARLAGTSQVAEAAQVVNSRDALSDLEDALREGREYRFDRVTFTELPNAVHMIKVSARLVPEGELHLAPAREGFVRVRGMFEILDSEVHNPTSERPGFTRFSGGVTFNVSTEVALPSGTDGNIIPMPTTHGSSALKAAS
ncbi:hypothetical protein MRY87_00165 [bacterium]|nr:hypothetical protein [bacterium]